jgi:hypothetical protein
VCCGDRTSESTKTRLQSASTGRNGQRLIEVGTDECADRCRSDPEPSLPSEEQQAARLRMRSWPPWIDPRVALSTGPR